MALDFMQAVTIRLVAGQVVDVVSDMEATIGDNPDYADDLKALHDLGDQILELSVVVDARKMIDDCRVRGERTAMVDGLDTVLEKETE